MAGVLIVLLLLAAGIGYSMWLRHGVRPRELTTRLSADQIRSLFMQKVARAGWTVVDDGNPMVAQSSLMAGIRQQIALQVTSTASGHQVVKIRPVRVSVRMLTRTPAKGHTLRIRMNSFVSAVQAQDPSMQLSAAR
jgi:hypothetical protein